MQVVILCGGLGTRLGSMGSDKPKSLVEVAGRPFIERQFDLLREHGLLDVLLCVGFRAEMIKASLGAGARFGMRLSYAVEPESGLLGTGGALVNALRQLEESFLVLYGDSFLPTDYCAFISAFETKNSHAMMSVFKNRGRWDASNVRIKDGRVSHYSKATHPGEADYIDYGLTALTRGVLLPYLTRAMPLDLSVIYGGLVAEGKMDAYEVFDRFYEIGKPEGLRELNLYLGGAQERT